MSSVRTLVLIIERKIPTVGLGTWNSPPGVVAQAVKDAIDAGYRHIDCAHCYQMNMKLVKESMPKSLKSDEIFPRDSNGKILHSRVDFVDTYRAMEYLVDDGLAKSIGVSNFNIQQLEYISRMLVFNQSLIKLNAIHIC
ncbi:hypothetical protein PVAND_012733 [Polypedilum vanderplanki]|uniref:NADP-dependent oxidoreductase domain-containing protein n=1 Tax=Polypedilum vanderplanki TaxID=319348 RepID=A0A9J6CPC5_POLVA|nr:hypothetical protein PVAND_012733 [Polypedilum vanderplanki]